MANPEHLRILQKGSQVWNRWREAHGKKKPELLNADLSGRDLSGVNLTRADLRGANFTGTDIRGAHLSLANLRGANLTGAKLSAADLSGANLTSAVLTHANLCAVSFVHANLSRASVRDADLRDADLRDADLIRANLSGANLHATDLSEASLGKTVLADTDLRDVKGLESVKHRYPSTIGIDTLYRSDGWIPESFLRGAGVPDIFIQYVPALVNAEQAIQYYSCFISYSSHDEEFAERLHSRLRDKHVRVWFAPEDMAGGKRLHEQIEEAIRIFDKLLLVLSEHSIHSEWVKDEIRKARKREIEEERRKLFPIRLVNFETLREWECRDSRSGQDLAEEVRQYFIPDFTNWKDHEAFEMAFKDLLKDLQPGPKAAAKQVAGGDEQKWFIESTPDS